MAAHDIRYAIPLTDQTNQAKFPQYEFREFPKMMNQRADQTYLDAWLERHKNYDDHNKPYWPGGRPRVGKTERECSVVPILDENAQPVYVHDEDEEAAFRADHPEALTIVSHDDEMQRLTAENDRLQALINKNAALRQEAAQVDKDVGDDPNKDEPATEAKAPMKAAPAKNKPALPPRNSDLPKTLK